MMESNEKFDKIFNRIRCLIILKSNFHTVIDTKMKISLDDGLPLEKTINMHNIVIIIISVFNESHNHDYYHVLLEKCSNE